MRTKIMHILGLFFALGLGVSAYAGDDLHQPGENIVQMLKQVYEAVPTTKPKEVRPFTEKDEFALLNYSVKHIVESNFEAIVAHMSQKLQQLAREAADAKKESVRPFHIWEATDEIPQPPTRRTITEIRKDARNILVYMLVQSLRTHTAETMKDGKRILLGGAAGAVTLAGLYVLVAGVHDLWPSIADGSVPAAATVGLVIGLFAKVIHNTKFERQEGERLFRQFADEIRAQNIDWPAVGINLEEELRSLAALLKGNDTYSGNYRKLCNTLLSDSAFLAPLERKRIAKPETQVRVEEFEPEAAGVEADDETAPASKRQAAARRVP